jgi:4-alpha-glucanotransferase
LWHAFTDAGVADGEEPPDDDPARFVDAALAFTASTPSPLFLPPLEDVLGMVEQPNLPGTTDQHPNWRRRLTTEVNTLFDEPRVAARVAKLAARRPRL